MRIGIAGSNFIVEMFAKAALKHKGIELNAICSRDTESERIKFLRKEYGIKNAFADFNDMIKSDEIDFVYTALPNSLHYSYALKALNAGKNVICEKPFTSTALEARELYETAKKNKLMLFEAIVPVHLPNLKIVKNRIKEIAPVRMVQLNYSQYSSRYDAFLAGKTPNVFTTEFSGGSLMDLNIYNVHFMKSVFGEPTKAAYFPRKAENGIDTSGIALFEYPGFTASLAAAKDADSEDFVIIQGEKGTIYVEGGANHCDNVIIKAKNKAVTSINEQRESNHLYYELGEFTRIFNTKDYDMCYNLCEYSIGVISLVEKIRKEAGIIFAAD